MENENYVQTVIHKEIVSHVQKQIVDDEKISNVADFLKNFADFTRVKIIHILSKEPMCVCDIAYLLKMSQSSISHQLRTLKQGKIVKSKRQGKIILYSLIDKHVETILNQALTHINE